MRIPNVLAQFVRGFSFFGSKKCAAMSFALLLTFGVMPTFTTTAYAQQATTGGDQLVIADEYGDEFGDLSPEAEKLIRLFEEDVLTIFLTAPSLEEAQRLFAIRFGILENDLIHSGTLDGVRRMIKRLKKLEGILEDLRRRANMFVQNDYSQFLRCMNDLIDKFMKCSENKPISDWDLCAATAALPPPESCITRDSH